VKKKQQASRNGHDRPPWDTSLPGIHPAFKPLTKAEIAEITKQQDELRELANSLGRVQMNEPQRWHEAALGREELHRKNYWYFMSFLPSEAKWVGGRKRQKEQINFHRNGLILALKDLGRFAEAIELAAPKGKPRPGLGKLVREITRYAQGVSRKDGFDHGCKPIFKTLEVPRSRKGETVDVEMPLWNRTGFVYSIKHGAVVDVWECSRCHILNCHNLGPPESQALLYTLREEVERHYRATGRLPDATLMDHILLKRQA